MSIQVQNLTCSTPELSIDSLTIERGNIYILLGANGAGKTSLLKALVGIMKGARASQFQIDGTSWDELSVKHKAQLIGYCPQSLMPHADLNTLRFLASAGFSSGKSSSQCLDSAHDALTRHQLLHLANRSLSTLSGGEWQRLILLSLELKNAPYWLLDEPTNHLDPLNQIETLEYLAQQAINERRAILVASHDLSLLGLLHQPSALPAPTALMLQSGRLVGSEALTSARLSQKLTELFGVSVCTAADEEGRTFLYPGRGVDRG